MASLSLYDLSNHKLTSSLKNRASMALGGLLEVTGPRDNRTGLHPVLAVPGWIAAIPGNCPNEIL